MQSKLTGAAKAIIARLAKELPEDLYYHSAQHTVDVIEECMLLANEDGLNSHQTELLLLSAAYHDTGFLIRYEENEELGANLAFEDLKTEYSAVDLEEIKKCILSTKLNPDLTRTTLSPLSAYLLDADLANLGKENIIQQTELLAKETKQELKELLKTTYALMLAHQWLTPAANKLRQETKIKNMARIKQILK